MHVNIIALPHIISILTYQAGDKGERKKLEIIMISSASHKWKNIASLICGDTMELMISVLDKIYPGDPEKCLRQIFINHFINGKSLNYSQDWKGLIEILDNVGLKRFAKEVEHALKSSSQHHEVSEYSFD